MRKQRKYLRDLCQTLKASQKERDFTNPPHLIFFPLNSFVQVVARLQLFLDFPGQIVGIINSDCRFRLWVFFTDFVSLYGALFVVGEVLYLFSGWRFNEIESVSNYILWWLFPLSLSDSFIHAVVEVKEIFIRSYLLFFRVFPLLMRELKKKRKILEGHLVQTSWLKFT